MTIIAPQPMTRGEQYTAALDALAELARIPGLPIPAVYEVFPQPMSNELVTRIQMPGVGLENRDAIRAYAEHLTEVSWEVLRYTTSLGGQLRADGQRGSARVTVWLGLDAEDLDDAELLAKALT
ncbi:hypothetical protein HII36_43005 [Nonomuraea sp. NN258]|uniref:hypothetical protein n=1 Tax=Nonomuraea antri TaxID=2730852 RepID=UPI00156951DC|nr:hypothetical protein [Nonomuraea antri]NRQ38548.1 hypothetical protein [Nonomuraea antri]